MQVLNMLLKMRGTLRQTGRLPPEAAAIDGHGLRFRHSDGDGGGRCLWGGRGQSGSRCPLTQTD